MNPDTSRGPGGAPAADREVDRPRLPAAPATIAGSVAFGVGWWFLSLRLPSPDPLGTDVDSSWRWAINFLSPAVRWGRDVAFTYGPFGWILQPLDAGNHLRVSHLLGLLAALAIAAWVTERIFRAGASAADALLPLGVLLLAEALGLEPDGYVFLVVALLVSSAGTESASRSAAARTFAAGALCGFLLFVKFNLGVGALGSLVLSQGGRRAADRLHGGAAALTGWAAGATAAAVTVFERPGDIAAFIRYSWEIARGFASGLSTPARPADLVLVALLLSLALAALALTRRSGRDDGARIFALALLPLLFLEFKHGFVRAWHRAPAFFAFAAAAAAFAPLAAERRPMRFAARGLAIASLAAALTSALLHGREVPPKSLLPSPARSWDDLRRALDGRRLEVERGTLDASWRTVRSELALPTTWRADLQSPGTRVSVLPWRLVLCAANELDCAPPPTLQLYSAYTPKLDEWTADWVESHGPDFLLVHFPETQQRHFYSSAPATWRAVRSRYQVRATMPERSLVLLERAPRAAASREAARFRVPIGEWTSLPTAPDRLTLAGRLDASAPGALVELLFQLPQPELDLAFDDGSTRRRRLVAAHLVQGFEVTDSPGTFEELVHSLRKDGITARPTRIRLDAPHRRWKE